MSEPWCMPELKKYAAVAYSNRGTIQNTYDLTRRVVLEDVPGALVECGVAAGAQIGVMGHYLREMQVIDRLIYAFDSYCGIPLAGPNDDDQPGVAPVDPNRPLPTDLSKLLKSSGVAVHSLESVRETLRRWELPLSQYVFVKGWFQNTVPTAAIEKIAFLRLDGDLYESTKVCLEHLFPKVSPGGYVVIDDYAMTGCRKACDEYFAPMSDIGAVRLVPVDPDKPEVHWLKVE